MCERTCPVCGSTEHFDHYGLGGLMLLCACGATLAIRADESGAPLDHPDPEAWAAERRGVLPGAEATDPGGDDLWRGPAFINAAAGGAAEPAGDHHG